MVLIGRDDRRRGTHLEGELAGLSSVYFGGYCSASNLPSVLHRVTMNSMISKLRSRLISGLHSRG